MNIKFLVLFLLLSFIGCASEKTAPAHSNLDQCSSGENCSLIGALTLTEIDHVLMGKLKTKDIPCINVSLPPSSIKNFSLQKEIKVIVTGHLYNTPILSEDDLNLEYRIENRRVGWTQCMDVYLFVDEINDIQII